MFVFPTQPTTPSSQRLCTQKAINTKRPLAGLWFHHLAWKWRKITEGNLAIVESNFVNENCLLSIFFGEVCSLWCDWWGVIVGLDNGLGPSRKQDTVQRRIYVTLGGVTLTGAMHFNIASDILSQNLKAFKRHEIGVLNFPNALKFDRRFGSSDTKPNFKGIENFNTRSHAFISLRERSIRPLIARVR